MAKGVQWQDRWIEAGIPIHLPPNVQEAIDFQKKRDAWLLRRYVEDRGKHLHELSKPEIDALLKAALMIESAQ